MGDSPATPAKRRSRRKPFAIAAAALATVGALGVAAAMSGAADAGQQNIALSASDQALWNRHGTATPIKHLVVIFQENVSFDHYFGTYPKAANTDGTKFTAAHNTPKVDGLTPKLLTQNPNTYQPQRLSSTQALTCDMDHGYQHEQLAFNSGKMDKFVQYTNRTCSAPQYSSPGLTMDYYDGNTVTGYWNYAQHYSMSDNSYNTVFGPSTPGALNLISGQTHGVYAVSGQTGQKVTDGGVVSSADANGVGTVINDPDPAFDDCSNHGRNLAVATGPNVGDLLNSKKVTWGWFQGGFRPTTPATANSRAICASTHKNISGATVGDYNPHHAPFQYYKSTSNPQHLPPSSVQKIGYTDQANHNYDLTDFDSALKAGNLPAVSYLKAGNYQDGHAGYSDPLDEQTFVVNTINKLQKSKDWKSTAVVIAYDDSDGWYDHKMSPIVNGSKDAANDTALCGKAPIAGGYQDRCGYGPRLPLLAISPYSKVNHVDHTVTDQSSILRFVEDNWRTGRIGDYSFDQRAGSLNGLFDFSGHHAGKAPKVTLDPTTGAVVSVGKDSSAQ